MYSLENLFVIITSFKSSNFIFIHFNKRILIVNVLKRFLFNIEWQYEFKESLWIKIKKPTQI
jgi:hypothetical protein